MFDLSDKKVYSLIEWRGDKSLGNISPVSNTYPDFVIEYSEGTFKKKFSIECKWRYSASRKNLMMQPEQFVRYQEYAHEKNIDVFIVLGIGGEPSMPEELYLVPIDDGLQAFSKPSILKGYKRQTVNKWFAIDEFIKENCYSAT